MDTRIVIRPGTPDDVHAVAELLAESAAAQGSAASLCVDAGALLRDGFGDHPRFHLLVAEVGQRVAGVALYFFNYSTWISTKGLYLEDLFIVPGHRRQGLARAMMQKLAQIARDCGCLRFQWLVLRSNEPAVRFYESLGARTAEGWTLMQLVGDDIERLAAG